MANLRLPKNISKKVSENVQRRSFWIPSKHISNNSPFSKEINSHRKKREIKTFKWWRKILI